VNIAINLSKKLELKDLMEKYLKEITEKIGRKENIIRNVGRKYKKKKNFNLC
tara:strand:- start:19087 stop:19242 length:156 start_codon:yes stop_codon:yes gene_type:complete